MPTLDKNIIRIFWFLAAAFILLTATVTYRQAFSAEISRHPANRISLLNELSVERGTIFTEDGSVIAQSKPGTTGFIREYPFGEMMAPVTGYYDPTRGRSGLELTKNDYLAGQAAIATPQDWFASLIDKKKRGADITVSLRPYIQETAWQALGDQKGAIVALDPKSGAILAMVSKPTFSPASVSKDWATLTSNQESPLINRATQGLYAPGSTFKVITAAAALGKNVATPETMFNGPAKLFVDGGLVTNFADQTYGRLSMRSAFAKSTNTIFAQIGLGVGAPDLVAQATAFGFGSRIPFDLPVQKSSTASPSDMDSTMIAWTAVGQGKSLATPLQMALVAAAVAGKGQVPSPYLVSEARDYRGNLLYKHKSEPWLQAMDPAVADTISDMMVQVVEAGTGVAAQVPDIKVAGKTGTAETGDGSPSHAWFIGFAPADDPKIAVAVLVENGGLGGRVAAPIARAVMRTALSE